MKLLLLKPLTKSGIELPAGAVIDIEDQDTASWLIETGGAERAAPEPAE